MEQKKEDMLDEMETMFRNVPVDWNGTKHVDISYLEAWVRNILSLPFCDAYIDFLCFEKKIPFRTMVEHFERTMIIWALHKCGGNRKKAASYLNLDYSTIRRKISEHAIPATLFSG
ncbi:MAG: hypothetical protein MUP70_16950 [Candidatus Aminicenantes bacterium]|nr:hypothetical protein [Candidatus Aminicenantes bacterium]